MQHRAVESKREDEADAAQRVRMREAARRGQGGSHEREEGCGCSSLATWPGRTSCGSRQRRPDRSARPTRTRTRTPSVCANMRTCSPDMYAFIRLQASGWLLGASDQMKGDRRGARTTKHASIPVDAVDRVARTAASRCADLERVGYKRKSMFELGVSQRACSSWV
eukprot:4190789-Pleurochrysis_carterae.AAC.1